MEVAVPSIVNDFRFDSAASSPYVSAPSSPKRFGDHFDYYCHYASAPTSPSRVAAIFASSAGWEDKPGGARGDDPDDFAFDFSGHLEKGAPPPGLTAADELFEKGKIRPLKPPPRLYNTKAGGVASYPKSPKSPRERGRASSTAAMAEATRERGRERAPSSNSNPAAATSISSSRSRKGSRSLSPMRSGVAGFFPQSSNSAASPKASTSAASSGSGSGRKWRLRDLLLFRSASEGRATGNKSKDPIRKYTIMSAPNGEDSRNSSFRSTDGDRSMRRGGVSPHEMHYTSNRAASEEMRKKTALPFNRQGLFGFLRFNPAVHSISRGFHNSRSFGRRQ